MGQKCYVIILITEWSISYFSLPFIFQFKLYQIPPSFPQQRHFLSLATWELDASEDNLISLESACESSGSCKYLYINFRQWVSRNICTVVSHPFLRISPSKNASGKGVKSHFSSLKHVWFFRGSWSRMVCLGRRNVSEAKVIEVGAFGVEFIELSIF